MTKAYQPVMGFLFDLEIKKEVTHGKKNTACFRAGRSNSP